MEEVIVYENGEGPERPLVERINTTLNRELADPKTVGALLATTFKGLDATKMKQALMEGMIRGFEFRDFLVKDIYAIPFAAGYSLMTSIDHARKRGMRSDVLGVGEPTYGMTTDGKKIEWCAITIKRLVKGHIGEFTAKVYFDEYYKAGYNGKPSLWDTKPRTMIAKVAEMHALRKACPEELSHIYVEEEFESEVAKSNRYTEAKSKGSALTMGNLLNNGNNKKQEEAGENKETPNGTGPASESNEEQDNEQPPN